ncbi:hypothetical protein HPB47_016464, partial [Ixodes persulcatus]
DNTSLRDRLGCDTHDIVTARLLGRKGRTAMITFEGNRLPRFVRYAPCITPVYPYRAKAVTCTNCHGAGHKQDICHKETVCSLCGKHQEETQDDQGNSNPNVCPKKTEIGKLLRERARKHAKPNQESRRKNEAPQLPPPPPPLNPIQLPPMLERTYAELVRPNQDVPRGQAMVYLRSDWPQHQIDLKRWCTDRQEVVAVRAMHQGRPVIIASVYYRPGASSKSQRDNGWIEQLHILYPKERKIIGGDFNLPHTSWGYKVDTINGQKLLDGHDAVQVHTTKHAGLNNETRIDKQTTAYQSRSYMDIREDWKPLLACKHRHMGE